MRKPIQGPEASGSRHWQIFSEICPHLLAKERPEPSFQIIKSPAPETHPPGPLCDTGWVEKGARYPHPGHHLSGPSPWAWLCTRHAQHNARHRCAEYIFTKSLIANEAWVIPALQSESRGISQFQSDIVTLLRMPTYKSITLRNQCW